MLKEVSASVVKHGAFRATWGLGLPPHLAGNVFMNEVTQCLRVCDHIVATVLLVWHPSCSSFGLHRCCIVVMRYDVTEVSHRVRCGVKRRRGEQGYCTD